MYIQKEDLDDVLDREAERAFEREWIRRQELGLMRECIICEGRGFIDCFECDGDGLENID